MTPRRLDALLAKRNRTADDIEDLKDFRYFLLSDVQSATEKGLYEGYLADGGLVPILKNKFWLTNIEAAISEGTQAAGASPAITPETASDVKAGPAIGDTPSPDAAEPAPDASPAAVDAAPAVTEESSSTEPDDPLDAKLQAAAGSLKDGQQVTIQVQVGDTGKTAEMTMGAKDALADVRKRLADALQLTRCLK